MTRRREGSRSGALGSFSIQVRSAPTLLRGSNKFSISKLG